MVKGMPLGLAGRTGTATGVHLHFEYWKDEVARDPLKDFARLVGDEGPRPLVLAPSRSHKRQDRRRPQARGSGRLIARGLLRARPGNVPGRRSAGRSGRRPDGLRGRLGARRRRRQRRPPVPHAGRGASTRADPARRRGVPSAGSSWRTWRSWAARRWSSPRRAEGPVSATRGTVRLERVQIQGGVAGLVVESGRTHARIGRPERTARQRDRGRRPRPSSSLARSTLQASVSGLPGAARSSPGAAPSCARCGSADRSSGRCTRPHRPPSCSRASRSRTR